MARIRQSRERFMQLSEIVADRIVTAAALFLSLLAAAKAMALLVGM